MTVLALPERVQRVEDTGHDRWAPLAAGGVLHRILYVRIDKATVTLETACGRAGRPLSSGRSSVLCANCRRLGWHPDLEPRA